MAGKGVATWVKVKNSRGFTSRPISHKYEGGAGFEPGQVITMSEYQKLKADGNKARENAKDVVVTTKTRSPEIGTVDEKDWKPEFKRDLVKDGDPESFGMLNASDINDAYFMRKGSTVDIPVSQVSSDYRPTTKTKEIAKSYKENGLMRNQTPVFVREVGENQYQAVHNTHLVTASKMAKNDFTWSIIVSDKQAKQVQLEASEMGAVSKQKLKPEFKRDLVKDGDPESFGMMNASDINDAYFMRKGHTVDIPVSQVSSDYRPTTKTKEIAKSYKKNGFTKNQNPVFVREIGENQYQAVYNTHLVTASKMAKNDFVWSIIVDDKMFEQLRREAGLD